MKKFTITFTLLASIILICSCTKPDVWEMEQWYVQLGRYRDSELRAYSLFLKVYEQEKIQKICDFYFEKYSDSDHYLQVDFFDDRSFTPNYDRGIEITEYQAQHRIAQFYYNPFRNQKRLEFFH